MVKNDDSTGSLPKSDGKSASSTPSSAGFQDRRKDRVPANWLLLGLSNEVGYGVMLQMPKSLARLIVPSSISFDIDLALLANSRLLETGHEVEIRGLIDRFLRSKDIEALRSLVVSANLEETPLTRS